MATYWKLYQARPAVFAELDALLEDADANRAVENGAALKFQCLFRGWRVRVWHAGLKAAAGEYPIPYYIGGVLGWSDVRCSP
mmetsp:Transcript_9265/g.27179  ORF Transcript_9265/g.27179 Transcript_9265/m.27179 type:complete len:82 (-) Transcript_9265:65-310(-)